MKANRAPLIAQRPLFVSGALMTSQPSTKSNALNGSEPTLELGRKYLGGSDYQPPEVLGDFVLEQEIGRGGMGIVYRAIENRLGRAVALKVLPNSAKLTSSKISRFQLEAKSAAQLTHDHIVPVYHVGYEKGTHYFAMRLIDGSNIEKLIGQAKLAIESLSTEVPSHRTTSESTTDRPSVQTKVRSVSRSPGGPQASVDTQLDLSLASLSTSAHSNSANGARSAQRLAVCIAQIGHDVADALHHAHQHGIIHRDIKPSNLMIDEQHRVWVTDFGLAQLQGEEGLTNSGEFVGTLRYMSPEQASGRRLFIDHRTDIYSLGVTLYEMATLQKACPGDSPQEILRNLTFSTPVPVRKINSRLPKDFEAILCRATERNPAMRYQTAAEFALDLSRFARGEPLPVYKPQRIKRVLNWLVERPGVAATITTFTIFFCMSSFVIAMFARQSRDAEHRRADLAEHLVNIREAQQLSAAALLVKEENPGLAIAAAVEGASVAVGPPSESALMAVIDGNHELRTIPIELANAGKVAVSPDGRLAVVCTDPIAFASGNKSAPVIELASGKRLGDLECTTPITEAVFDPSGKFILTNSTSYRAAAAAAGGSLEEIKRGELQLWDAQSLRLLKTLSRSPAMRIGLANFSSNGRQIVLPTEQGSATVFDLPTFQPILVLPNVHGGPVVDAIFSHDDKRIATWATDATAVAWDASDGKKLQTFAYRTDLALSATIAFTHDSDRLCISGSRGTIVVSLKDGTNLFSRRELLLGCSATDHWLYFLSLNRNSVLALNLDTTTVEFEFLASNKISGSTLSSDGRTVALTCGDNIEVFDGRSGRTVASLRGHTDQVISTASIEPQQQIASISRDGTLRLWTKLSDLQRRTLPPLIDSLHTHILTCNEPGTLAAIGNVRSQRTSLRALDRPNTAINQFEGRFQLVLANGQLLTSTTGACWLWDVETQRKVQSIELSGDASGTVSSALELSSRHIALLSDHQQLFLWDLQTNSLSRVTRTGESVRGMVKTAENQVLFGLSDGELLHFTAPMLERKSLYRFSTAIASIELSSAKDQLLISTHNKDVVLWNLAQKTIEATIETPEERVPAVLPIADRRCLSHAHMFSKSVKVWNRDSRTMEKELPVQGVRQLIVNHDGKSALVLTGDRALVWRWDEDQVETIVERACTTAEMVNNQALIVAGAPTSGASTAEGATVAELVVWDMNSRSKVRSESLEIAADAKIVADSSGKFWVLNSTVGVDVVDLKSNQVVASVGGFTSEIVLAQFITAGDELLTVSRDGRIYATRFQSGQRRLIGSQASVIQAAAVSSDRRLLMAADDRGEIWKWDLSTSSLSGKVDTQGKSARWLSISQSGTTAAAVLGNNDCLLLDLRTGSSTRHTTETKIQTASLSSDGTKLLLILGDDENAVVTAEAQQLASDRVVAEVITLGVASPTRLRATGSVVEGQFVSGNRCVVLLSGRGKADVFDLATGKATTTIVDRRPITRLLVSNLDPETIFAVSGEQIGGWTVGGIQTTAFSVPGLKMDLAEVISAELIRAKDSPWYLVYAKDQVVKHPVQPLQYARQIAPRKLTALELKAILWTPTQAPLD